MALTAGELARFTVVLVPDQGGRKTGMQGMGVRTPMAADVAAATVGFVCDVHIPKVGSSAGVAFTAFNAGVVDVMTVGNPMATTQGARPLSHMHVEPELTIVLTAGAATAALAASVAWISGGTVIVPYIAHSSFWAKLASSSHIESASFALHLLACMLVNTVTNAAMPRHFPVLRLSVLIAALASGLSLVVGLVAAVTLLVMGIAGGRLLGGLVNGLAAAAAGAGAAFCLAALGEAADVLLDIHAALTGPPPGSGPPAPAAARQGGEAAPTAGLQQAERDLPAN